MAPTKKPRSRFRSGDRSDTRVKYSAIEQEIEIESDEDEQAHDAVSRDFPTRRNSKMFKSFPMDKGMMG